MFTIRFKRLIKGLFKHNTCRNNINNLKNELSIIDWSPIIADQNVQSAYKLFYNIFFKKFSDCCPYTKVSPKIKYEKSPWMTSGIFKSIRFKNKLYYRYKQRATLINKATYTKYRNILSTTINIAKKMHFTNLIQTNKGNSTQLWKIINSLLHKKTNVNTNKIFECSGGLSSNDDEIANNFVNYFSTVAKNLADKLPEGSQTPLSYIKSNIPNSFIFYPTDVEQVKSVILNLSSSNSAGHDHITNNILKHVVDFISIPLTHIINLSFSNGSFPNELKIAKIIPIFKSGDKKHFSNYRPISVLSSISKIFERLAYNRLIKFITKHDILYTNQYGFRQNHSTYMAALSLIDRISTGLDNKLTTAAIFIDLSKAFDTIDHSILMEKLFAYGIRGTTYKWFYDLS